MKKTASILILVLVLTSFCYFHVKPVFASAFSDGFEDDFTAWTSTDGDPETSTSVKYEGLKSFNHTIAGGKTLGANVTWANYDMTDDTDWWLEAHVYIESFNPSSYGGAVSNNYCPIIRLVTNGPHCLEMGIDKENAGANVTVYGGNREGSQLERGSEINLSQWYLFEAHAWYEGTSFNWSWSLNSVIESQSYAIDDYGDKLTELYVGANYGAWNTTDTGNATWFIDSITLEGKRYYFNFNFYDLDSENVELYVDWALWNSTHDINYAEGQASLSGTYYLKTSKYEHLINTTTLDTATYGNSTIDINLNMKRHQSCPNGFIASNETISSTIVHVETPQLLNFTSEGTTPCHIGIGVAKNASYILEDGVNMTGWVYVQSPSHIHFEDEETTISLIDFYYAGASPNSIMAIGAVHPSETAYKSAHGQCFKPTKSYNITSVKFQLRKHGSPTGEMVACLYNMGTGEFGNGGKPSEEAEPLATSDIVDIASLGTSFSLPEFVFPSGQQYRMLADTPYCVGFQIQSGVLGDTDYVETGRNKPATHEGNAFLFANGGWGGYTDNTDSSFYVYGTSFTNFALVFPSTSGPVVGPHTPMNKRVKVTVRLNGEWLKGCNVTVEGGPDNRAEWALTDVFGVVKFKLATGSYDIVASYEEYSKSKPVYVSTHMTIGIDLTKEDIISPDVLPEDFEEFLAWLNLPELDLTTETLLVFILPLIVLVVYAVKKASEGPERKWKYSYLK